MAIKPSTFFLFFLSIRISILAAIVYFSVHFLDPSFFPGISNPSFSFSLSFSLPSLPSHRSSSPEKSLSDAPLVPALFVIGDSSVDCGNNNTIGTFGRADHPPYGIDFEPHRPTGRFCNGRTLVDFLALRLGLPIVPSYLGQEGSVESMIRGVNYASAGARIVSTGSDLGLAHQIEQLKATFKKMIKGIGSYKAIDLIFDSIVYISIGTDEYTHYYLRNVSGVQSLFPASSFNHILATNVIDGILDLIVRDVAKVVVMGLPPMGCAPHYLWRYKSKNGECIQHINDMIMDLNFEIRHRVEKLKHRHPHVNITFCDVFKGTMHIIQNHRRYGFQVATDACCGLGKYKGGRSCLLPEMACKNTSSRIWWDQFHPTAAVNAILADNVWSGLHTNMCYPMNMKNMVLSSVPG